MEQALKQILAETFGDKRASDAWLRSYSPYLQAVPNDLLKRGRVGDVLRALFTMDNVYV